MVLSKSKHGDGLFSKSIRVWTEGFDGENQHFREALHPLVGAPRNVSINVTANGYLLTWDSPDYGVQHLDHFTVRWFQGPDEFLLGEVNTRQNSYFSKYSQIIIISVKTHFRNRNNIPTVNYTKNLYFFVDINIA